MRNPCVAHRGWSGKAPENTLAAIQLAMREPDLFWTEIDVQLSKDNVPVVIHDYILGRTTNGFGEVRAHTAQQLQKLDAGSWFDESYRGEPVPTLEQVLSQTCGRCRLNIELKTDGRYAGLAGEVLKLVYKYGLQHDIVLTSFHPPTLREAREQSSEVSIGLIIDGWRESLISELKGWKADFLSLGYPHATPKRIKALKEAGITTMLWTLNDVRTIKKYAALDPDVMICTNYPDRWREAVLSLNK
ncbi:glycerophosphodiester phosphodiesterase [Paenibacillus xylaniclasticus]|uniref:glycerophosphodiester phosphodiesterase n=1 Tax=Paenibacillus xylaniclasticus TaxID=588083 RepID=UPI000FD6F1E1|nr:MULTISPECIES: glycerophosphodiester phosphodiesterase family protein [Paenibacillus]GFN30214.1 putative glycerophosphoryl diester phosphodiesterase YhdW [Paenibacillus curdlanolyticus]